MTAWIVAASAWTMAVLALPPMQRHVPPYMVQFVHGAALTGFLLMCFRWWQGGFAPGAWNDAAFGAMLLGLAADGCIRARLRHPGGRSSAA